MKLLELLKSEFAGFGKIERVIFPSVLIIICIISIVTKGNIIALISAICGISYTILAGKGRVSCYFIGILGTLCYSYMSFINGFYGNLALYALYYLPVQTIGIFKWSKHLKKDVREIEKTKLSPKQRIIYAVIAITFSLITAIILHFLGDKNPVIDSITTILSIIGMLLTINRCIEQWHIWIIVNFLSFIMWLLAYQQGSDCLATVLMWFVYSILAIYFFIEWHKEIKAQHMTQAIQYRSNL